MMVRLLALIVLVLGGIPPVAAQAQDRVPLASEERAAVGRATDTGAWSDELGRRFSLESLDRRFDIGAIGLGLIVASRRPNLDLPDAGSAATRYRLAETQFRATDVGLDLRLRWPSAIDSTGGTIQPYVGVGPAISLAPAVDSPFAGATMHPDPLLPPMALGMRGALGLMWQISRDASLYGEYRLSQDRPFGSRTAGELGVDLFYGFSIKF